MPRSRSLSLICSTFIVLASAPLADGSSEGRCLVRQPATPDARGSGPIAKPHDAPRAPRLAPPMPGQPPAAWRALVNDQIRLSEYRFSEAGADAWSAPNRKHGLRARVDATGVLIAPRTRGGGKPGGWELLMRLTGHGHDGSLSCFTRSAPVLQCGRLAVRGGELTEWYENGPEGLKQGFTIEAPAAGGAPGAPLILEMTLSEGIQARLTEDGASVVFRTDAGVDVLRYADLAVFDAKGARVEASLVLAHDTLQVRIQDSGASYPLIVDPLMTTPSWTAEGNQENANLGQSVASAGDVNGDGFDDVIIGAPTFENDQVEEGRAFLYLGSATGLATTSAWMAEGDQDGAYFGASVASADVNYDGFDDVVVGAPLYDNDQSDEGRAYLYLGSASGLATSPAWTAEGDQADSGFGYSVASAGTVYYSPYDYVIVGAHRYDNTTGGLTDAGAAFLYAGIPSGLSASAVWSAFGDQADALFGISVASAGDVNGDGLADVIIGAANYNNGEAFEGRAYLYRGDVNPLVGPVWTAENDAADSYFGTSVAGAGDVNGDAFSDIIVGATGYYNGTARTGRAYVFHGSLSGPATTPSWFAEGDQDLPYFGNSVASAGDVNGDRFSDVVIGAYNHDNVETDEGRAYVYLGSTTGLAASPAWTAESDQASSNFGVSVASAGDVNFDCYSDVITGALNFTNGENNEGRAFAYYATGGTSICDDGDACTFDTCEGSPRQCLHVPMLCEDNNFCTEDSCDTVLGCQFVPRQEGAACDDGNLCTTGETCQGGYCTGTSACDDGNLCTGDSCDYLTGQCTYYPQNCDDRNVCTTDSCDPQTGQCVNTPLPFGTSCTQPCITGGRCLASSQQGGVTCDGTYSPNGTPCNDGQPCTIGDVCEGTGFGPPTCRGNYEACDDGDRCTSDRCEFQTGQCMNVFRPCDDGNPCTTDACNSQSGCSFTPVAAGTACDDNNPCTLTDTCADQFGYFTCVGGSPAYGTACDDNYACSIDDRCVPDSYYGARCIGTYLDCRDIDACTQQYCNPSPAAQCQVYPGCVSYGGGCTVATCDAVTGNCQYTPQPDGTPCSDAQSCTTGDVCQSGFCAGTSACDDGNACTDDYCGGAICYHYPRYCYDGNGCTADTCDPATGSCLFPQFADGTPCTDSNVCTGVPTDVCQAGVCQGNNRCDDGNSCTSDSCNPATGGCSYFNLPDGSTCSDGSLCTAPDTCSAGQCSGPPSVVCDDGSACTSDSCDPPTGQCQFVPLPLSEVTPVDLPVPARLVWSPTPGATHWNSYRGSIPAAFLGSRLPGSVYDHTCYESADEFSDGATASTDPTRPPLGTAWYYEATEEGACGEGPMGAASSGASRPNTAPCPTPP